MRISRVNSPEVKTIIALLAFVIIIASPGISNDIRNTEPVVTLDELNPIEGEAGYTVFREPHSPIRSLVIYNETFGDEGVYWQESNGWNSDILNDEDGVFVELHGTEVPLDVTYGAYAGFFGTPTLPLLNYSEIKFLVRVKVLKGTVRTTLRVIYHYWPDFDWTVAGENSTFLEEGQSGDVLLSPPPGELTTFTSEWIIRTSIFIRVSSFDEAIVQIDQVSLFVESSEDLYPVTIDMQAPDGESLFLNPYTNLIGPTRDYWDVDGSKYPALSFSRSGNVSKESFFGPRISNETIYLPEGTYEGTAGWFYNTGYFSNSGIINISITVTPEEAIILFVRVPTFRLYISITPDFAYTRVRVGSNFYEIDLPLQGSDFLYLPRSDYGTYSISFRPLHYESHRIVDRTHYDYNIPRALVFYEATSADYNLRVTAAYAQYVVFGTIVDSGFLLGLVGIVMLFLLLIQGAATRGFSGVRKDYHRRTNLIPVIFYYISIVFPWATYSFETDVTPATEIFAVIWPQLYITTWTSPDSQSTLAPSSYLMPNNPLISLVFWVSIFFLSYLIVTKRGRLDEELNRALVDSPLPYVIYIGPFAVGCYYVYLCIVELCVLNIGLIAALLTAPSWVIAYMLRRRREKLVDSMHSLD